MVINKTEGTQIINISKYGKIYSRLKAGKDNLFKKSKNKFLTLTLNS